MTERERFQQTFSHLHASETAWTEVNSLIQRKQKHTERQLSRRAFALALAAVLLLGLGVTAYAVNAGFHQREQELIRQQLQVSEHHIASYVEYGEPEEPREGITLLSAYNSGGGVTLYFTVSPVAEEDVRGMFQQDVDEDGRTHYLLYLADAGEEKGLLAHFYTTGDWEYLPEEQTPWTDENGNELLHITEEGKRRRWLAQAYDAETQTLTLSCGILGSLLPTGAEEFELHVASYDFWAYPDENGNLSLDLQHEIHQDFGTVTVPVPEPDRRQLRFAEPIRFENPEYSGSAELLGVDIAAVGLTWLVRVNDPQARYVSDSDAERLGRPTQEQYERQFSWTQRISALLEDAVLRFDDGSEVACGGIVAYRVDEELALHISGGGWPGTIDLTRLKSLSVAGRSFPLG